MNKNFNEKDIYKSFNDMNFDDKEYENIHVSIDDIQKSKIKNKIKDNLKFKKMKKRGVVAAIVMACTIGVIGINSGLAKNIPIINSITQSICDKYNLKGEYAKYSKSVGLKAKDKGYEITIKEVIADDSQLVISYTLKGDKDIKSIHEKGEPLPFLGNNILINKKKLNCGGGLMDDVKDDKTIDVVCTLDLGNKKLPSKFAVDLTIDEVFNTKGNWKFSFNVCKEDILQKSTTIKPNISLKFPGCRLKVKKVLLTPINTTIYASGIILDEKKANLYNDHNGGVPYSNWAFLDENEIPLIWKETSANSKRFIFNYKYVLEGRNKLPKYLKVVPYKIKDYNKHVKRTVKVIDGKYPIKLTQGKFGEIIIDSIKDEENKTVINYHVVGKAPFIQYDALFIKDDKGIYVKLGRHIPMNKEGYFKVEVEKLKKDKKYFLVTNIFDDRYVINEDLIFTIPVKK